MCNCCYFFINEESNTFSLPGSKSNFAKSVLLLF